jgi:alkyldihydroxyacetonephosphate synthase
VKVAVDRKSLIADVDGRVTLGEAEAILSTSGLTLDLDPVRGTGQTVAAWLAAGAPGAREAWLDPADHLVAGCLVRLRDGSRFEVRPAPRRAVGPDLVALVIGMGERFAKVERAWLRVHPVGVRRPNLGTLGVASNPEVSKGEAGLLDAIFARLADRERTGSR